MQPTRALAGFREASPIVAERIQAAAAVAVFVDVESTAIGCAHIGTLVFPDGAEQPVLLRCLQAPRAPGGSSYHQLVILRHASQVEQLRGGTLDLSGMTLMAPHDVHSDTGPPTATGWIVSTHHSQLLFGDQRVPQQLEWVSE